MMDVHRSGELTKGFVKVIHLCQYTDNGDNGEGVGGRMAKLIVPVQAQFQSDSEGFDRHN